MKVVTGDFGTAKEDAPPKITARAALEYMLTIPEIDDMEDAIIYVGSGEYSAMSSTMPPPETYLMLDLLKMTILEEPDEL